MLYKLIKKINNIFDSWISLIKLSNLSSDMRCLIFYAETSADWAFLNPVAESLELINEKIIRITSDSDDRLLSLPYVYYIGFGGARTLLFRTIKADVFVMTLTDLGSFYLKRSLYPVHYFYIFHSIASTHRVYREHAFDAYDTILCVGNHQIKEIRKTEEIHSLPKKNLEVYGYGRLDTLITEKNKKRLINKDKNKKILPNVLIAPSWGECSLVNQHLDRLINILILANFSVTLRLHPMTNWRHPELSNNFKKKYEITGNFSFDPHIENVNSLLEADIMISEWSGAPLEYAFATERPVIFVDTQPKINNLNWKKINLPCLEETIRKDIGKIVSTQELESIPKIVKELIADVDYWSKKIRNIREHTVFNIGTSSKVGTEIICKTLALKQTNNDSK